ncbi:MAG: hypothetical protein M3440_04415 [Chloroflexota bacterium]|nr:hypothetical protein [Chloroflexota bacterium]
MATSELTEQQNLALRDWLPRQRWYGDKSRYLEHVTVDHLTAMELDPGLVTVMLLSCDFADTARSTYFAPVLWGEAEAGGVSPHTLQDAFVEPEFLAWLYSGFADARTADVSEGRRLRWIAGAAFSPLMVAPRNGQVLGGEQSNTSVRFGNEAILKVFRKVEPGVNPDPEILRFLSTHSGYQHAPADLGTIELQQTTSAEPIILGAMQAFVPNSGDAWTWLLKELRTLNETSIELLLSEITLLGQRTGDLHLALATSSDDPAFSVGHISVGDRERLHRRIDAECRRTLDAVRSRGLRGEEQLVRFERRLTAMLAAADALDGLALTRVHGDFHLGQVLKAEEDFIIIDFEGEPSRPFHERREKASPLKDVAGMLRSLDYAVATAGSENPDPDLRDRLARFGLLAKQAYTETYLACVSAQGGALVPANADRFAAALSIFLIEKALYEVRYELDNRPDWIEIPLGALETLAAS